MSDVLAALLLTTLLAGSVACRYRAPAAVAVLTPPRPLRHDIGAWLDDDIVCVHVPPIQALYVHQRCLSMITIRALILSTRTADGGGPSR